jgi:hypothetical protein
VVSYAVSKSVTRVQIREVLDAGSNEIVKTSEDERRLRLIRPTNKIREMVDIDFLRCDPGVLSIVAGVGLAYAAEPGFGEVPFGEAPFGGYPGSVVNGFDVSTHQTPAAFGLEVWTKLAGQRCADGTPMWGYSVFPFLRGGRISGVRFANGLVSFRVINSQTRRGDGWGVGPHDLEGAFERLISPVSRNTGWRMFMSPAAPPAQTDGILLRSDVLDNGTAANPMPDPTAPLVVDGGGAQTSAWIIDGGRA